MGYAYEIEGWLDGVKLRRKAWYKNQYIFFNRRRSTWVDDDHEEDSWISSEYLAELFLQDDWVKHIANKTVMCKVSTDYVEKMRDLQSKAASLQRYIHKPSDEMYATIDKRHLEDFEESLKKASKVKCNFKPIGYENIESGR